MVVAVAEGKPLPKEILDLDKMIIETALVLQDFTGKDGQVCTITLDRRWLVLVGIGKNADAQNIGGLLAQEIKKLKKKEVFISVAGLPHFDLAKMAFGVGLGLYSFDVYKTKKDENKAETLRFLADKPEQTEKQFEPFFGQVHPERFSGNRLKLIPDALSEGSSVGSPCRQSRKAV